MIIMDKSSGLAEIVKDPSPITIKYLNTWFTGSGAFGKALSLLDWPVTTDNSPLLIWDKMHGLRVDLKVEEIVMYSRTILRYYKVDDDYQLQIDYNKLLSLINIVGTIKAIWSQSKLLIDYQKTYDLAKSWVESIPTASNNIELDLENEVWPKVIAVDYVGEFVYSALTNKLNIETKAKLINKLHSRISPIDWYTKAILSWAKVNEGEMRKDNFVREYGFCAGDDYELTKPRYYEILKMPKPTIEIIKLESMKIMNLEDLYVGVQYLRSQAKRKSLVWISALRDLVVKH